MQGKYFEDFNIGDKFVSFSRKITEADLSDVLGLMRTCHPLFMDDEYARSAGFEGRIAPGVLTIAVTIGLFERIGLLDGTLIALLSASYKFLKPVRPGDTLRVEVEVIDKKEVRKPDRGIIVFKDTTINQKGEVVMVGERAVMVARKPK